MSTSSETPGTGHRAVAELQGAMNEINALNLVVSSLLALVLTKAQAADLAMPASTALFVAIAVLDRMRRGHTAGSPERRDRVAAAGLRGAIPFGPDDELYGRDNELGRLLAALGDPQFRLGVVHGDAGAGKTSLVAAGLVRALRRDHAAGEPILVDLGRNPAAPSEAVRAAVQEALGGAPEDTPDADARALLRAFAIKRQRRPLVILDHAEAAYVNTPDATGRESALNSIRALLAPDDNQVEKLRPVFLVVVREDVPELMHDLLEALGTTIPPEHRLQVARFTPETARAVLSQLADNDGVRIEPDVLEMLVHDLALDGVCPAEMQVVATRLKEHYILSAPEYVGAGRADGQLVAEIRERIGEQPNPGLVRAVLGALAAAARLDKRAYGGVVTEADLRASTGAAPDELSDVLSVVLMNRLVVRTAGGFRLVHRYMAGTVERAVVQADPWWVRLQRRLAQQYVAETVLTRVLLASVALGIAAIAVLSARSPLLDGQVLPSIAPAGASNTTVPLVAFSANGKYFAALIKGAPDASSIVVWDTATWQQVNAFQTSGVIGAVPAWALAFGATDQEVQLYGPSGQVAGWDVTSGQLATNEWHALVDSDANCLPQNRELTAVSSGRRLLALGESCNRVDVFDLQRQRRVGSVAHRDPHCHATALAFTPHETELKVRFRCLQPEGSSVRDLTFDLADLARYPDDPDVPVQPADAGLNGVVFGTDGNARGVSIDSNHATLRDLLVGPVPGAWPIKLWEHLSASLSADRQVLAIGLGGPNGIGLYRRALWPLNTPLAELWIVAQPMHLLPHD